LHHGITIFDLVVELVDLLLFPELEAADSFLFGSGGDFAIQLLFSFCLSADHLFLVVPVKPEIVDGHQWRDGHARNLSVGLLGVEVVQFIAVDGFGGLNGLAVKQRFIFLQVLRTQASR
jgi:hypothetical protein